MRKSAIISAIPLAALLATSQFANAIDILGWKPFGGEKKPETSAPSAVAREKLLACKPMTVMARGEHLTLLLEGLELDQERMLVAAHAWSAMNALFAAASVDRVAALPSDLRVQAERWRVLAGELVNRALTEAPHLRVNYSFGVVVQRSGADVERTLQMIPQS